ncbi:proline and serine-rich protein 3 [Hypanus sabinus]|uniref:proline and serine-rich protein 3 n=1 Tax=Hypanus sabinus TaxID=79690 RepID=UPI0028C392DB|nr:proline and serine-rich protein 3 [Hypanus sabinus]
MERATGDSALFSHANPFVEPLISRSHYCPSLLQSRSKQQQRKVMREGRIQWARQHLPFEDTPSAPDPLEPTGDGARSDSISHLEESWPSSESASPSTLEGASSRVQTGSGDPPGENFCPDTGWVCSPDGPPADSSIIAKYIQRFRHARPQSREQRAAQLRAGLDDFWWLHNSPRSSSTPNGEKHSADCGSVLPGGGPGSSHSPFYLPESHCLQEISALPVVSSLSLPSLKGLSASERVHDSSLQEPLDPNTLQLQERAHRLLEHSESTLSDPVPVSSEGVGSPPESDAPSLEETSRRPLCVPLRELAVGEGRTAQLSPASERLYLAPARSLALRPEDDILYQWRLRRKMEVAQDSPWLSLPVRMAHSPPVRLPRQVEEFGECGLTRIGPSVGDGFSAHGSPSQPQPNPFLPQCSQCSSQLASQRDKKESAWCQTTSILEPGLAAARHPDSGLASPEIPEFGLTTARIPEPRPSSKIPEPRPVTTRILEPALTTTRISDLHPGLDPGQETSSEPGPPGTEILEPHSAPAGIPGPGLAAARIPDRHPRPDPGQESSSDEACSSPAGVQRSRVERGVESRLAPSDVHHVLGQVISEAIFSPPPPQLSRKTHGNPRRVARAMRKNRPTVSPSARLHLRPSSEVGPSQSPEVLAQLLEEAEESDGVEFEEDVLLQVLRQQRDWVRRQLREANLRLESISCQGS